MIVEVDAAEREMNLEWGVFEGGERNPVSFSPAFQPISFPLWEGKAGRTPTQKPFQRREVW